MTWTEERVELLKKLWAEGKSASQIAKELGSVTRNAVIGKVHRLGLSNRHGDPARAAELAASESSGAEPAPTEGGVEPTALEAAQGPSAEEACLSPADDEAVAQAPPELDQPAAGQSALAPSEEGSGAEGGTVVAFVGARPQEGPGDLPGAPPLTDEISSETLATVREVEKRARKLTLMELTERTCKWPIGDPATPNFYFCGLPTLPGKPYCEAHAALAYQPVQTKRDRRR